MHPYLENLFESEKELEEHLFYGGKALGRRDDFIVGLYGMVSESTMIKGQNELAHFFNAITHCVNSWTEKFKRKDQEFRDLWNSEEWEHLISYEQSFIAIYPRLTNWKNKAPEAPELFELDIYQKHRRSTLELFEQLSNN